VVHVSQSVRCVSVLVCLSVCPDSSCWTKWPLTYPRQVQRQGGRLKFTVKGYWYTLWNDVLYGCTWHRDVIFVVYRVSYAEVVGATSSALMLFKTFDPKMTYTKIHVFHTNNNKNVKNDKCHSENKRLQDISYVLNAFKRTIVWSTLLSILGFPTLLFPRRGPIINKRAKRHTNPQRASDKEGIITDTVITVCRLTVFVHAHTRCAVMGWDGMG